MNTVKVNVGNTKMIAHRGCSGLEPENTMPAFVAGGNRSYYGLECDIHVTSDGKFIVTHDDETGRVCRINIPVDGSGFEELRALHLNNICKQEADAGLTAEDAEERPDLIMPSLEEYINICKKYEKKAVVELKNEFDLESIKQVVKEMKALDYLEEVIFISFQEINMIRLRELLPQQKLQFLVTRYNEEVLAKLNQYNWDIDISDKGISKEMIDEVHANGHVVNCWTVDKKERAEQLAEWGIDFITTNILE